MSNLPKRILYESWINSQLSIARHCGGMMIQGVTYRIEQGTNDLVADEPESKPKRERKKKQ